MPPSASPAQSPPTLAGRVWPPPHATAPSAPGLSLTQEALLEELLCEQQTLQTPVAWFARAHETRSVSERFAHLIPLSKPEPGSQYAFEVNLDACTGCKACVAACHSLNGLDENEAWRDTGLLLGNRRQPYLQTVTSACHHCLDPACADGCPVLAYDKDPVTGIVRHLDDQCIGCSYCILKCPYDVPKFNLRRGIVRKCDMCQGRLAKGEAPACVQACPNEAIRIRIVETDSVPPSGRLLPGVHDSGYTRPTTRYLSSKPIPETALPADAGRLVPDHGHPPLAWMLVLTQLGAGGLLGAALTPLPTEGAARTAAAAIGFALAGIALSILHLGQPLKAWRAFLGWRKSWLSREILAFGALPAGGAAMAAAWWLGRPGEFQFTLAATAAAALTAVACSVMVYADTRRPFWSVFQTSGKFFGTTALLGASLCSALWSWAGLPQALPAMVLTEVLRWTLSLWELTHLRRALAVDSHPWHRSARLLQTRFAMPLELRGWLLILTGLILPALMAAGATSPWLPTLAFILTCASQLIERHLFFTAACGSKMPGH
jgi:formate dehydrogenase iron-sulfur subunit